MFYLITKEEQFEAIFLYFNLILVKGRFPGILIKASKSSNDNKLVGDTVGRSLVILDKLTPSLISFAPYEIPS